VPRDRLTRHGKDGSIDCTGALQADAGERSGERLVMRFRERR